MVYRFRVTYEDHEDVFRDIDIKSSQSFVEFHSAIQQAIAFDNSKPATFFVSDDYWRCEEKIISVNTNEKEEKKGRSKKENAPVKKTIAAFVNDPHQKFVYVFDPEKEWTFQIELIKILPEENSVTYPRCFKSSGNPPKQYKETNLPPPPPDDDEEPKTEKEDIIHSVDEKISDDDEIEGILPLKDEDVETDEEKEAGGEDERGEISEGFEFEDDNDVP